MICYRDMTFCEERNCSSFSTCPRAYTEEVHKDAVKWWGNEDFPIALFVAPPECFKELEND